ncbi:MAG: glycosyltransferase family 1 protein [Candidatus Hadarchaeota archaeon]
MLVNYIIGEKTGAMFGQSRHQKMVYELLKKKAQFNVIGYKGLRLPLFSLLPKHLLYPKIVNRNLKDGVIHIASHEQAHLLDSLKEKSAIVTVFDVFPIYILKNRLTKEYGWSSYMLHRLDVPMWAGALKKAARIISISEFSKKEVVKNFHYPAERVTVTHLGVDTGKYKPLRDFKKPFEFEEKVVMYSGTEEFRKNVPVLLKAFYKIKKKLPGVKLVKVGKAGSKVGRAGISSLIDQLGLQNDVTFFDYVPENELPKFYNSADVFVFPSSYEGFGLPPLEAMACGVPVVTSNAASLPEVVGDAGIMKNSQDVSGFADAIYNVLTDDGLSDSFAKKGLKRAKSFSWQKTAEKTFVVYKEVGG